MRSFIRIAILTALLVLMAVLLASCGGENSGTSSAVSVRSSVVMPFLDVAILMAGGYYMQVHTVNNPAGEVRGQIMVPPGAAGIVTITVPMNGANEAPPVASAGTGTGTVVVNLASGAVVSVSVTVTGLSSVATAAHIHQGAAGVNGIIVVPVTNIIVV